MERCSVEQLDAAGDNLILVYQPASGFDNVDVPAIKERGLPCCYAPGTNANAVAEGTVMLMLGIARKLPTALRFLAEGKLGSPAGMELRGKRLAIIGITGASGKITAQICRGGFNMDVVGSRSTTSREDLREMIASADVVSLHCPLNSATVGLIGAAEFSCMKKGCILVNCARGPVVDRAALEAELALPDDERRLGGFACDVFWTEPAPPSDPLLSREDCLFTPHMASATHQFYEEIAARAVTNTAAAAATKLDDLVDRLC